MACKFCTGEGETVHRRIVVRRHVDGRQHVFDQHAIERTADGHAGNAAYGLHEVAHDGLRLRDGQGIRIVIGQTRNDGGKGGHDVDEGSVALAF